MTAAKPNTSTGMQADPAPPSLSQRFASWLMCSGRSSCEFMANLESRILADELTRTEVREPVFIAGLARAGSTILLESLASLPAFASARYRDYPPIWFPYWWDRLRARLSLPAPPPRPRAHADGIEVTPDSPEAFDEVFWMHFWPDRHDPRVDQRLGAADANPRFDAFYTRHIKKTLWVRGASRYLCKGNYNLLRLPYLQRLFPDARFVVPIRAPAPHVVSLTRQHRRFVGMAARWPSIARQLARSGHFEFGPQRRAECVGDPASALRIQTEFECGDDISAYARQWAQSYGALDNMLTRNRVLAEAVLVVRLEDLHDPSANALDRLVRHCRLDPRESVRWRELWAGRMRAPPDRGDQIAEARERILEHCADTARRFGYSV